MTRLGRIATTMNWRYALGEVLLIVIGVSIALAASSWWEGQNNRAEERAVLQQISAALEVDLQRFENAQTQHLQQESDIISLIEHMEGDELVQPNMSPWFRAVRTWIQIRSSIGPYEALKNRGHELISNPELLSRIIFYYELQVTRVSGGALNDRDFVTADVYPYLNRHFYYENTTTMTPLDYESLRRDNYFRSLVMTKLLRLQSRIIPAYQETNKMIRDLISDIDQEIGETL